MIEDHKNGKPHQSGGNFYDWLTDVKGIELTLEETEMYSIPEENLTSPEETLQLVRKETTEVGWN